MTITGRMDSDCWIMRPGFGSKCLHLGQLERDVRELIGKPESITRKYEKQYFYNYPSLGLEVDFGKRGGTVSYLFFFREGFQGNHQGPMQTSHGIKPGDPMARVRQLLGKPKSEGPRVKLSMGGILEGWFRYEEGINFQFGPDELINMITIAPPLDESLNGIPAE